MKKFCIFFLLSIIISLTAIGFSAPKESTSEYLRMHIRAHSNSETDQLLKYGVRDVLITYLTPVVANCESKAQSVSTLAEKTSQMQSVVKAYLKSQGFSYGAKVAIRQEQFPTRVYEGYTLPAGEYTALIVELGEGTGNNWWCVVYPPLCFTATPYNVQYKSKIAEIIQKWKNG